MLTNELEAAGCASFECHEAVNFLLKSEEFVRFAKQRPELYARVVRLRLESYNFCLEARRILDGNLSVTLS